VWRQTGAIEELVAIYVAVTGHSSVYLFVDVGAEPQDHELGEPDDRLVQERGQHTR
jgi:hypothetical protein